MLEKLQTVALAVTLVAGGWPSDASATDEATSELTIRASGFLNARGHAVAKLFIPGDNVLGPGRWQITSTIEGGEAVFRVAGLKPGRYAAVVFHDLNDNGTIDHGLVGPSEPLGFSGRFVLSLVSGRPDFEQLQFELKPPAQTLEVRVK